MCPALLSTTKCRPKNGANTGWQSPNNNLECMGWSWDDAWNDHIHNHTHQDFEFSGFPSSRSKALAGLSRDAIDQTHKITTAALFTQCLSSESSKRHKPYKRSQMRGDLAFSNHPRKKEQNTCSSSRSCLLLGLLLEPIFPCPESGITTRETESFSIFFPPPFPLRETQSL